MPKYANMKLRSAGAASMYPAMSGGLVNQKGGKIMGNVKVISFQTKLDEFYFLGIENVVKENSDFGAFWGNFFDKGGYDKIDRYAKDPHCINVWFNKESGEKIYFQGKIVGADAQAPEGYTLAKFPPSEYLVVTTEWLATNEETMQYIDRLYHENTPIPDGYVRHSENGIGVYMLERWGANTGDGYRYEFWLPIKQVMG